MKRIIRIMMTAWLAVGARAEMRTWSPLEGDAVEGEYVSVVFDNIVLRDADGREFKLPLHAVSEADRKYVELANPPKLTVDLLESADQVFVKTSPIWEDNSPVTLLRHAFGARIKQTGQGDYNHELRVEIFAVAQQVYDTSKYHLVYRWESEPFRLTAGNNRRIECRGPRSVDIAKFLLDGRYPRGQRYAESLIVVRDERGEVVAYNTTKNWLFGNLDKLSALPTGAWFDKTCLPVHPTSPKPVWLD